MSGVGHINNTCNLQLRRYKIYNFNTTYLIRKSVNRYTVNLKHSHGYSVLKIC